MLINSNCAAIEAPQCLCSVVYGNMATLPFFRVPYKLNIHPAPNYMWVSDTHLAPSYRFPLVSYTPQMDWNDSHCYLCHNHKERTSVECDGACLRLFHLSCLPEEDRPQEGEAADTPWYCPDCKSGRAQCKVCGEMGILGGECSQDAACKLALRVLCVVLC